MMPVFQNIQFVLLKKANKYKFFFFFSFSGSRVSLIS